MGLRVCGSGFADCDESSASSYYGHRPSTIASVVFMAVTALCLVTNCAIVIKTRSCVTFSVVFGIGCLLNALGWGARFAGARDPWGMWPWMASSAILSVAPIFITTSIFLVLGRLVTNLGLEHSLIRPKFFKAGLLLAGIIALAMQGAGFGIAFADVHHDTRDVNAETHNGSMIILGASALELISLIVAIVLLLVVGVRAAGARRARGYATYHRDAGYVELTKAFMTCAAAVLAAMALLAGRLGYRVALLTDGIRGSLARNQNLFLALDGLLVALAICFLTLLHPSFFLDSEASATKSGGRGGKFEKLREAEDAAFSTAYDGATEGVTDAYTDSERPAAAGAAVPLQPLVFEPPKSYDPQALQEGSRYEATRDDEYKRKSLTVQAYEVNAESRDASRDTSPKPYGSGGL